MLCPTSCLLMGFFLLGWHLTAQAQQEPERPSLRELGLVIGELPCGKWNAITDVPGVLVGQVTVIRGGGVRTGVTAVLPHPGNLFLEKVPGAVEVFNGFGKLAGSTQVNELGQIETPILLTNTLAVPRAADALIGYMLSLPGMEKVASINPLVAETNDWWLNDIRTPSIGPEEVHAALASASSGRVALGSVGAGTGTRCMGFKGGIGTASRLAEIEGTAFTVGVLVQTNFGGRLTVSGMPVGKLLEAQSEDRGGSCMIVVATDAPLAHHQLRRLAKRSFAGMARTGASFGNGSGDYAVAFCTAPDLRIKVGGPALSPPRRELEASAMDPLFDACAEATEEAILSSLVAASTVTGRDGHRVEALPLDRLKKILGQHR